MKDREKEYKEIFIAEALQEYDDLSRHIVELEKDPKNEKILGEIFRLLHNLKANAKATGYLHIADLAHSLESVFSLMRNNELSFEGDVVTVMYDGFDYLGVLLHDIDNPEHTEPDVDLLTNIQQIIDRKGKSGEVKVPIKKIYTPQNISLSDLIYIQVKKLDDILNLVGELIIDRDRISSIAKKTGNIELVTVTSHLERVTNELQFSVMDARLVNIGSLFNKFPRIVRDVALTEGKTVELEIFGQDVQIDRNILQVITDSLLHITRNAITHGIEDVEERKRKHKSPNGTLSLSASADKDTVIISIEDDGKGIDVEQVRKHAVQGFFVSKEKSEELNNTEILSFIFEPGFSLSKKITEISGRGVGLDIVKTALDSIGGKIRVDSEKDKGTTFNLILPNSIAVKGALLFEVSNNAYAIPLIHTESVLTLKSQELHQVGNSFFADIKGETIPVLYLRDFFQLSDEIDSVATGGNESLIIVTYNSRKLGLIVDKLLRQQNIVVKPLQQPVNNIELFGGVTLLGNGEICLIIDVPSLSRQYILKKDFSGPIINN